MVKLIRIVKIVFLKCIYKLDASILLLNQTNFVSVDYFQLYRKMYIINNLWKFGNTPIFNIKINIISITCISFFIIHINILI